LALKYLPIGKSRKSIDPVLYHKTF